MIELPPLPPPSRHGGTYESSPFFYHSDEAMIAFATLAVEEALEAAAKIADTEAENGPWNDGACRDTCAEIAAAIRALKDKP